MIGLDTNILVRYLTQDDPVQSAKAAEVIEQRLSLDDPGFLSVVVVVETAWVLQRCFGWSGPGLASILERVLQADVFVVEHAAEISEAVMALKRGQDSFPDTLIAAIARTAGCSHTLTFDRKALRLPGFAPV